jgi:UDP-glucose 4-epimerase
VNQNDKTLLLTGGGGLVGRHVTPLLRDRGWEITHFDTREPGDELPCIIGDLRDREAVTEACQGKAAVMHIAAVHGKAWREAGDDVGFDVNVTGTRNVLQAAADSGAGRVVFTSSIWASGHDNAPLPDLPIDETLDRQPAELYGLTKILGEQMCRYYSALHEMSTIVVRPGGIATPERHGPGQVGYMVGLVDVRDVAAAHVLALEAPEDIAHDVFIVTADSPLCTVDREAYLSDPAGALDAVVPGVADLVARGELDLPPQPEYYTVAKARRVLGYQPQYNFYVES